MGLKGRSTVTQAADSAACQGPSGESDRERPAIQAGVEATEGRSGTSSHHPVFAAFNELGLTGRDVAEFAGVTPPTVSKWRSGKVRIPGERLAFLTLVLAHLLDDAQAVSDLEVLSASGADARGAWSTNWSAQISSAKAYLAYQEVLNRDLDGGDIREGAQLFRLWWVSGAAQRLQEKRFSLRLDAGQNEVGQVVWEAQKQNAGKKA